MRAWHSDGKPAVEVSAAGNESKKGSGEELEATQAEENISDILEADEDEVVDKLASENIVDELIMDDKDEEASPGGQKSSLWLILVRLSNCLIVLILIVSN